MKEGDLVKYGDAHGIVIAVHEGDHMVDVEWTEPENLAGQTSAVLVENLEEDEE